MDKHISELNGRIFYYAIFAGIALLVLFLFYRYWRMRRLRSCTYCGRNLWQRSEYKDVVNGMPRVFCNGKCSADYRERGEMPAEEQQVLRAKETIDAAL